MTFHEEVAFRRSRELPNDADMEEQEAPASVSPDHESTQSDEQREEAREPFVDPTGKSVEIPLEVPPVKRRPTWCEEILKEAKKHAAPKGTFRESMKPKWYSDLAAVLRR